MERLLVEDITNVAELMYDMVADGYDDISFVCKYEDATHLIKELLMSYDETNVYQVSIETIDWDGYDKEYIVTLDGDMNIWCEKAYQEEYNRYLFITDECVLVADDCNSKILDSIDSDEVYEVGYNLDNEEECHCNCENCKCNEESDKHEVITRVATDESGKVKGFEKSWNTKDGSINYHTTYSFYSNNDSMLKDMMKNFDIKF